MASFNWGRDVNIHTKQVLNVSWNCDGHYLAGSSDKTVKIGQLDTGGLKMMKNVGEPNLWTSTCWHPTEASRFLIAGEEKIFEFWDMRAETSSAKINVFGQVISASWSPDGNYVACSNRSDYIAIIDVKAMKIVKKVRFAYEVNELSWTANSAHLLVATANEQKGTVDLLHFENEDCQYLESIPAHGFQTSCLQIDRNYQTMVTGSLDHTLGLWDLEDLVCHHTCQLETPCRGLSIRQDGRYVAVVGDTPVVHIFDTKTGERRLQVETRVSASYLAGNPSPIAWHPRLDLVAIGFDDRETRSPQFLRMLNLNGLEPQS